MIISDAQLESLGWTRAAVRLYGPLTRAALGLAIVIVLVVQSMTYGRIVTQTATLRHMQDFGLFYAQARRVAEARVNPYEEAVTLPGSSTPQRGANLNPPLFLLLMGPLARLEPMPAFVAWAILSCASAFAALRIAYREARIRVTPTVSLWTVAAICAAAPTGALLMAWQVSWLVWGPLTWAWAKARRGDWTSSALVLGLLMSVKPFLGLFLLAFAVQRRRRPLAVAVLTSGACFGVGLLGLGWEATRSWLQTLEAVSWTPFIFNASIQGFVERAVTLRPMPAWDLAPLVVSPALALPLWIVAAVGVLLGSWLALGREPRDADRLFAVVLGAALLVSPLGWIYYECLLVGPVLALCARERWWSGSFRRRVLVACAAAPVVMAPGVLAAFQPSGWATVSLGSAYFWSLLALWIRTALPPRTEAGTV